MLRVLRKYFGRVKFIDQPEEAPAYINLHASKLNYLRLGEKVDDFELMEASGKHISLYEILEKKTVIISFHRGSWCPHCNLHLKSLEKEYGDLMSGGVSLLGISPDSIEEIKRLKQKQNISFDLLSDDRNKVARKFGVVVDVDKTSVLVNKKLFDKRFDRVGESAFEVPVPSTFIIDKKGVIVYSFIDTDHTVRLSPKNLVEMAYKKLD